MTMRLTEVLEKFNSRFNGLCERIAVVETKVEWQTKLLYASILIIVMDIILRFVRLP